MLTRDEVIALLSRCSPTGSAGIRNRALFTVLWRAGLRIGEALALYEKDLQQVEGEIRVLHGKGDKFRTCQMDAESWIELRPWLERRARLGLDWRHPLFCTVSGGGPGKALAPGDVREALRRAANRAGIAKRVHPHGLRHTLAYELAREGVPLPVIKAQLGHSSIATTHTYVQRLAPGEIEKYMKGRTWRDEPRGG